MLVIPAIDLRRGQVVRLTQGDPGRETVYAEDPTACAEQWAEMGAERLHIVDLDGAFQGAPAQLDVVARIVQAVGIPVQVGGGLRTRAAVDAALGVGAAAVVLGTSAILHRAFLDEMVQTFPGRVILALDAREGQVAVKGWQETIPQRPWEIAKAVAALPLQAILYTDIHRDGTLEGPNFAGLAKMAAWSETPILASGGIASVADLRRLCEIPGIMGTIVGKALYTGAIRLGEALQVAREQMGPK